jgi:hypothetical protein
MNPTLIVKRRHVLSTPQSRACRNELQVLLDRYSMPGTRLAHDAWYKRVE